MPLNLLAELPLLHPQTMMRLGGSVYIFTITFYCYLHHQKCLKFTTVPATTEVLCRCGAYSTPASIGVPLQIIQSSHTINNQQNKYKHAIMSPKPCLNSLPPAQRSDMCHASLPPARPTTPYRSPTAAIFGERPD